MGLRARRGSKLPGLIITAGAAVVMLALVAGWDFGWGRSRASKVLGTSVGPNLNRDSDGDGIKDGQDLDDDGDGWSDAWDPKFSLKDLDNDGINNVKDKDDDGDGIVDAKDRVYDAGTGKYLDLSWDQNNNKKTDAEERAMNRNFDGDGDGRSDLTELKEVVKAQAARLGVAVAAEAKTLADYPKDVYRNMPRGWWYVVNDADNDGIPKGLDKDDKKRPGSYGNYTGGGAWGKTYSAYQNKGDGFGFVPVCLACSSQAPERRFDVPTFYSRGGAMSWGQGQGSQPHASFYQKYERGFFGKYSGNYRSQPQHQGGDYYKASATAGGGGGAQSGGSWFSGSGSGGYGGGGAGTGGGDAGSGGGGGGASGGSSGGVGGCSKC